MRGLEHNNYCDILECLTAQTIRENIRNSTPLKLLILLVGHNFHLKYWPQTAKFDQKTHNTSWYL